MVTTFAFRTMSCVFEYTTRRETSLSPHQDQPEPKPNHHHVDLAILRSWRAAAAIFFGSATSFTNDTTRARRTLGDALKKSPCLVVFGARARVRLLFLPVLVPVPCPVLCDERPVRHWCQPRLTNLPTSVPRYRQRMFALFVAVALSFHAARRPAALIGGKRRCD